MPATRPTRALVTTALLVALLVPGAGCAEGELPPAAPQPEVSARSVFLEVAPGPIVGYFGKCLAVRGAVAQNAQVVLSECTSATQQSWVRDVSAGKVRYKSSANQGLCLNVGGGGANDGAKLILWPCGGWYNEYFTERGAEIRTFADKCLNVSGGSHADDSEIIQWPCGGEAWATWSYPLMRYNLHLLAVGVADDNWTNGPTAGPADVRAWVDAANPILARARIQLTFANPTGGGPNPDWLAWNNSRVNTLTNDGAKTNDPAADTAARAFADAYPGRVVVFLTRGTTSGGFSAGPADTPGQNGYIVLQGNPGGPNLAHELGHYLGLDHTFGWGDVNGGFGALDQANGDPAVFDGDVPGGWTSAGNVADTPPDPGDWTYMGLGYTAAVGLDPCSVNLTITRQGANGRIYQTKLDPIKNNLMSYWPWWNPLCSPNRTQAVTPDQIAQMRLSLLAPNRMHLVTDSSPQQARAVAAAHTSDGRPYVVATTTEGTVVTRTKLTHDSSSGWTQWLDLAFGFGAVVPGRVAVAHHRDGTVEPFVVGSDTNVYSSRQLASGYYGAWAKVTMPFGVRDLTAGRTTAGSPRLYAVGTDGRLAVRWYGASSWGSWQILAGPSGTTLKSVTMVTLADGRDQLFAVCGDGQIRTSWQTAVGGAFTAWQSFNRAGADVDASFTSDGRVLVVAVGTDGSLWQRTKVSTDPNSAWSAWTSIPGAPGAVTTVSAARLEDGRPQLLAVSRGAIFTAWGGAGATWSGWIGY